MRSYLSGFRVVGIALSSVLAASSPRSHIQHLPLNSEKVYENKTLHYKVSAKRKSHVQQLIRLTNQVGEHLAKRTCIVLKNSEAVKLSSNMVIVNIGIAKPQMLQEGVCGYARRSFRLNDRLTFTKASIKISKNCLNYRTLAHEILHVLGFNHVQGRADSEKYFGGGGGSGAKVMKSRNKGKNPILQLEDVGAFDCESIMLYKDAPLTLAGKAHFEENKCETKLGATVGSTRLSDGDFRRLNWLHCDAEEPSFDKTAKALFFGMRQKLYRIRGWKSGLKRKGEALFQNFFGSSGSDRSFGGISVEGSSLAEDFFDEIDHGSISSKKSRYRSGVVGSELPSIQVVSGVMDFSHLPSFALIFV